MLWLRHPYMPPRPIDDIEAAAIRLQQAIDAHDQAAQEDAWTSWWNIVRSHHLGQDSQNATRHWAACLAEYVVPEREVVND